jgi:small subunit ribosomal protein S19e
MLADRKTSGYTVRDVPAQDFIKAYAQYLKKNDKVKMPSWIDYVKTGKAKDLAPEDPDWLYTRIAAVARKIYLRAHLGVGTLRHIYGGKNRFGHSRNHHRAGAGKIIRYSLQTLEGLGVLNRDKKCVEKKFSRTITSAGRKELDIIANSLAKEVYKQN